MSLITFASFHRTSNADEQWKSSWAIAIPMAQEAPLLLWTVAALSVVSTSSPCAAIDRKTCISKWHLCKVTPSTSLFQRRRPLSAFNHPAANMQFRSLLLLLLTASTGLASPIEEKRAACSPVGISGAEASRVKASFTASGIVPTLIPGIDPKVKVDVRYGDKAVDLGNQFQTTGISPSYLAMDRHH